MVCGTMELTGVNILKIISWIGAYRKLPITKFWIVLPAFDGRKNKVWCLGLPAAILNRKGVMSMRGNYRCSNSKSFPAGFHPYRFAVAVSACFIIFSLSDAGAFMSPLVLAQPPHPSWLHILHNRRHSQLYAVSASCTAIVSLLLSSRWYRFPVHSEHFMIIVFWLHNFFFFFWAFHPHLKRDFTVASGNSVKRLFLQKAIHQ